MFQEKLLAEHSIVDAEVWAPDRSTFSKARARPAPGNGKGGAAPLMGGPVRQLSASVPPRASPDLPARVKRRGEDLAPGRTAAGREIGRGERRRAQGRLSLSFWQTWRRPRSHI